MRQWVRVWWWVWFCMSADHVGVPQGDSEHTLQFYTCLSAKAPCLHHSQQPLRCLPRLHTLPPQTCSSACSYCGYAPLWGDLLARHAAQPLCALVGGGDQLYNDVSAGQW